MTTAPDTAGALAAAIAIADEIRAELARLVIPGIHAAGGDAEAQRAFQFPAFVEQPREFLQSAAAGAVAPVGWAAVTSARPSGELTCTMCRAQPVSPDNSNASRMARHSTSGGRERR